MKKCTYILTSMMVMLSQTPLFGQENDGEAIPGRDQGIWQTVIMIAIALVFFYFILFRPEQKRRKALEDQRSSLKKGDKVTAMGIIGTVLRVQENTVILKMYDGSKIEVVKGAITDVLPGSEEDEKKADKEDRPGSKKVESIEGE